MLLPFFILQIMAKKNKAEEAAEQSLDLLLQKSQEEFSSFVKSNIGEASEEVLQSFFSITQELVALKQPK